MRLPLLAGELLSCGYLAGHPLLAAHACRAACGALSVLCDKLGSTALLAVESRSKGTAAEHALLIICTVRLAAMKKHAGVTALNSFHAVLLLTVILQNCRELPESERAAGGHAVGSHTAAAQPGSGARHCVRG